MRTEKLRRHPFRKKVGLCVALLLLLPGGALAQSLEGVWQSRGWALIAQISSGELELYQYSQSLLLPLGTVPLVDGEFSLDGRTQLKFRRIDEALELSDTEGSVSITFAALETLPEIDDFNGDPVKNFEHFAELFAENYALFDLNQIDWNSAVNAARPLVSPTTSDDDLFDVLSMLMEPLNDRHVTLASDQRFTQSGTVPDPFWTMRSKDILANISLGYLGGILQSVPGDDRVQFGALDSGRILYLAVLDLESASPGAASLPESLDDVLGQFPHVEALIVDLRSNGGGRSANGNAILDRLTDTQRIGWFQQTRSTLDDGFTPLEAVMIAPAGENRGAIPTALLVSGQTASTADRVAMGAALIPGVTLIGTTTLGILSNTLDLVLANRWTIGLSHQRMYTVHGGHFEQLGIAPDIEARLLPAQLGTGTDPAIDAALRHFNALPEQSSETHLVDQRANGVWFDRGHSGEGWIIEVLPNGLAFVTWFTYAPPGSETDQSWITATGIVSDSRIILDKAQLPVGARFGDAFLESEVDRQPWGKIVFEFNQCDGGRVVYEGPDGFRAGMQRLDRLTSVPGLTCQAGGQKSDPSGPARYTGSWFVPGRSGEGWMLSANTAGSVFVAWFTYGADGEQVWLVGTGVLNGNRLEFPQLLQPLGGQFGPGFDPEGIDREVWGSLSFDFSNCDRATIQYQSDNATFGSGSHEAVRLTTPVGIMCE